MNRTRDFYRKQRAKHIARKRRIVHDWWDHGDLWKPAGYFSKNKIHCSCPMCTQKVSNLGWTISDQRKIDSLNSTLNE